MGKKLNTLFAVLGALLWIFPMQGHALSMFFSPSPVDVNEGDSFTIDLLADIRTSEEILGWDIDLSYDVTQMSFNGATLGSDWNAAGPLPDDDVSIAGLAPFGLPPGTGISGNSILLATLSFDCLTSGSSLVSVATDDLMEGFLLAATPGFANWSITPVSVDQASVAEPVPEPGTIILLGTGLLGIVGYGRKKIKKE